jgi:hypothetical protein
MRSRVLLISATACLAAAGAAAPAQAALPGLGGLTQTVTTLTGSLSGDTVASGSSLTDVGGVVTGVTGAVGGLVTGTTSTLTGALQGTLDQVTGTVGGLLPTDLLLQLLAPVSGSTSGGAVLGGGTSGGPGSVVGGVVDARAPNARIRILTGLKRIGQTGRLRLRVTLDEAGVALFGSTVRPGRQTKRAHHLHPKARYSRRPIHFPTAALAFRRSGTLDVTVRLSRRVQRRLGQARDGRISLALVTADLSRNQSASHQKKHLHR